MDANAVCDPVAGSSLDCELPCVAFEALLLFTLTFAAAISS